MHLSELSNFNVAGLIGEAMDNAACQRLRMGGHNGQKWKPIVLDCLCLISTQDLGRIMERMHHIVHHSNLFQSIMAKPKLYTLWSSALWDHRNQREDCSCKQIQTKDERCDRRLWICSLFALTPQPAGQLYRNKLSECFHKLWWKSDLAPLMSSAEAKDRRRLDCVLIAGLLWYGRAVLAGVG